MKITIKFWDKSSFVFENCKSYKEEGKYLIITEGIGYEWRFDFDDIDNYKVEE